MLPVAVFAGAGADTIHGSGGSDWLDGGIGADQMYGGAGNDIFIVDNALDQVFELNAGGIDTIYSSVNIALPANVEKLVLTGTRGASVVANALNNWITGNGAANILNGGAGADRLIGGDGNDIYTSTTSVTSWSKRRTRASTWSIRASATCWPPMSRTSSSWGRAYSGTGNAPPTSWWEMPSPTCLTAAPATTASWRASATISCAAASAATS